MSKPTPETDSSRGYALSSHYGRLEGSYLQMDRSGPFVHAEVARKLEHERDKAREKIERQADRIRFLEGATNHACGTPLSVALRERDEAQDAILGWENKWKCAIDMAAIAEIERDDALNKLNDLKNILR